MSEETGTDTLPKFAYHIPETDSQIEREHKVDDVLGIEHQFHGPVTDYALTHGPVTDSINLVVEDEKDTVHFHPSLLDSLKLKISRDLEKEDSQNLGNVLPDSPDKNKKNEATKKEIELLKRNSDEFKVQRKSKDYARHGSYDENLSGDSEFHVRVGHYGIQGRRLAMEDHHIQLLHPEFNEICGIQDQVPRSYFAVFDGHGGPACAQFCTRSIHKNFVNSKFWKPDENESLAEAREKALKDGINSTDKDFCERLTSHGLTTSSGSTAIIAYIEDDTLIVANVGDSRAVLCSDGKAIPLSCDQRPKRTDEQDRISASGGFVGRTETEARSLSKYKGLRRKLVQFAYSLKLHRYPYRVYPGGIAVSRSLGDLEIKNSGLIISEAETIRRKLGPKDEFIILACDGLWDVMSNTDAVSHVKTYRQAHGNHPKKAAKSLVFEAYQRNSMDNITAICIFFSVTNPHSQYQNDSTNVVD